MRASRLLGALLFVAIGCRESDRETDRTRTRTPQETSGTSVDTTGTRDGRGAGTTGQGMTGTGAPGGTTGPGMPGTTGAGGATGGMGGTAGTGPAGTGGAGTMASIDCNAIVPNDVRSRYLQDMTVTASSPSQAMMAVCELQGSDSDQRGTIQASCDRTGDTSRADVAQIKSANPRARDVEVGKTAVLVDRGATKELSAWDDDSNCQIRVTVPQQVDAVAVGRAVLDQLPPRG